MKNPPTQTYQTGTPLFSCPTDLPQLVRSHLESCRRFGLPVKQYLADVLPGLNRKLRSEVSLLTPARWATRRS